PPHFPYTTLFRSGRVLAERRDVEAGLQERLDVPAVGGRSGPDPATHVVREHVPARERRRSRAAVDVAAADRAAPVAAVGIAEDRQDHAGLVAAVARLVATVALHDVPAVVLAARRRRGLEVHLLEGVLPDVGDVQVARRPVEPEAPRVAQAVGPDLRARAALVNERVVA